MDTPTAAALAQLGFAVVMAILLLGAYRELVPKMLEVLAKTAEANTRVAAATESHSRAVEHLADTITWLEKRLIQMDNQRRADEQRGTEERAAALR